MTLRICHLISGDLWAGAEVMAFHLLSGLNSQPGTELFVILLNEGKLSDMLREAGVPTFILDERKQSFLKIAWTAAGIMRKKKPHILHSHRYKENILSYLVSLVLRKKVALVTTQHGMPELYGAKPNLWHRIKSYVNYGLLSSRFDKTVAVSLDISESLKRDYGIQGEHLEIIHNGVLVPEVSRHPKPNTEFVIGSAGRFFPVKDYLFMVEVAKAVCAENDKIRFELAGDGPMLFEIQRLINKYDLAACFTLRGFIHNMSSFYQGLDIYMNTSLHEGIPMSILESMAHGIPPIVPKVGGLGEIVMDGVDGYVLDERNPRIFAEKCLSLYEDETLRRNMSLAAREKVINHFSMKRMTNTYLEMYSRLAANVVPV